MIAIVVNSCYKFYQKTIPPLIESAKKANITPNCIYVVVGESEEAKPFTFNGEYHIAFCKYVNIDFNAAIYISNTDDGQNAITQYSHFMHIHDTSAFLPHFWERIQTYTDKCPMYFRLEQFHSKSTGLLNTKWFLENKTKLLERFINYDINLAIQYKKAELPIRAELIAEFPDLPLYINEDSIFCFINGRQPIGEYFCKNPRHYYDKIYNDDIRRVNVYEEPGLIKYQKNWGESDWTLML